MNRERGGRGLRWPVSHNKGVGESQLLRRISKFVGKTVEELNLGMHGQLKPEYFRGGS